MMRALAYEALCDVYMNGDFSDQVIDSYLTNHELNELDKKLFTNIVYGTIQHQMTLDYYVKPFIQTKIKKDLKILLWMSVYQMEYLDRVPTFAIINEAVEVAKNKIGFHQSQITNGILRAVSREGVKDISLIKDPVHRMSIKYSMPHWIIKYWRKFYEDDVIEDTLKTLNMPPLQWIRVNSKKMNKEQVIELLELDGYEVLNKDVIEYGFAIQGPSIQHHKLFNDGILSMQDISSMLVTNELYASGHDLILDTCSAPGGKTMYIANQLDEGHIVANDINKQKVADIKSQIQRLGINCVTVMNEDSREYDFQQQFDRIIVDAPCSGLGVLRRKPEIKYNKTMEDMLELSDIQLSILNHVKQYLKPGGTLVYSTCTIFQQENENVSYTFKKQHEDIEFDHTEYKDSLIEHNTHQILPQHFNGDGFFVSRFIKK